jgi:type IV pilus assembly protein PilW
MNLQRGLTMVEMMIAMALSLVLLLGVLQILQSTKDNNRTQDELARLQERGRFAVEVLSRDIRMAAFYGCLGDGTKITNNLDPAGAGYSDDLYDFEEAITGTEGGGDVTDSLILRGAYGSGMDIETPYMVQASSNVKVTSNTVLEQGAIVVVCDYEQGDVFQITNANPGTGTVVHNTGSAVSPGNYNVTNPGCPGANAHCLSKVYEEDAMLFMIQSIQYTIATGANGQPALFRNGVEIAEGIENLQILYGEDQDGNQTADRYATASEATLDMDRVVSIRFQLLTRTLEDNLTAVQQNYRFNGSNQTGTDHRIRRVFSGTVVIRNRAS